MMSLQRAMGQMIWVQTSLALARLVILPRPPSRPYMLQQCRAYYPYRAQFACRSCQPLRSVRPLTSDTSITGMAMASCLVIVSRRTTAFRFMVRGDQATALQTIPQLLV